jgi:hypothetical protein
MCFLSRPSVSISRCTSRYEVHRSVSVISFISSPMRYMGPTKSPKTVMKYMCHKWPRYIPLVINTSWSFPHSWLIIGFVTRLKLRLSLVEQKLLIFPRHLSCKWGSCYSIFSFMRMFCRSLFVLLYFFFWPFLCFITKTIFKTIYCLFSYFSDRDELQVPTKNISHN